MEPGGLGGVGKVSLRTSHLLDAGVQGVNSSQLSERRAIGL